MDWAFDQHAGQAKAFWQGADLHQIGPPVLPTGQKT
jgi:hypothetical protein